MLFFFFFIELGDDFCRTWPRDTRSSVPETELSVSAVHVASSAFQTPVVTNEQMTLLSQFLLSQFVHQFLWQILCTFLQLPPRVRVHRCRPLHHVLSRCLLVPAAPVVSPRRFRCVQPFLALRSRFKSGSNRLAASSATTSAKDVVEADLVLRDG